MSVTIVLHEATRTGAPKVGGIIAAALQKYDDVRIICLSDGPLLGWLQQQVGPEHVTLLSTGTLRHRASFTERVRMAEAALSDNPSDIVYVNSLAASEFIIAGKSAGSVVALHLHEKSAEMRKLMALDLAKVELLPMCDGIVLAADELEQDLAEVFGFIPEKCLPFGIVVDVAEIGRLAQEPDATAQNAAGDPIVWGERIVIGMCGVASPRKGSDIFFEAAGQLPEHDFLWIGNWAPHEAPENAVYDDFLVARLPNLYVSGGVDNPYKYIDRLDLFFLSSREDPNPLVLAEALLLRVPILAFSATTAVTDFLGRSAILCHGTTNTPDAARVLRMIDAGVLRSERFRGLSDEYRARFDMDAKVEPLVGFLNSLQRRWSSVSPERRR
jgi:glycosyltransferase involved in cell wall biosynthesis